MNGDYMPMQRDELRDGPLKQRKCTDVFCLLLFLVFCAAIVVISIFGFAEGDPDLLLYPYDSAGDQCGRPGGVAESYRYLYFVNPQDDAVYSVCLDECPALSNGTFECYPNAWVKECRCQESSECDFKLAGDLLPVDYNPSYKLLGRYCVPDHMNKDKLYGLLGNEKVISYAQDLAACWEIIFAVMAIAIVVSVAYLVLVRYFAACVLWVSIAVILIVFVATGLFLYFTAERRYRGEDEETTWWCLVVLSIVFYVLAGLLLISILCLHRKISLAAAIVETSAIFLGEVKTVTLVPLVMFALTLLYYFYWTLSLVYLYSSGELEEPSEGATSFVAYIKWDNTLRNIFYFQFFSVIWMNSFKIAFTQFVVACSCSVWYFGRNREEKEDPVSTAVKYGLLYHLGSIAYGSLLVAIVVLFKWIFGFFSKMYKDAIDRNTVARCCCACVYCCFMCFEKFLGFLNRNAYIRMALTGDSFCKSAREALAMIIISPGKFLAVSGVSFIFEFLGRVTITALSSYIGYLIITQSDYYLERLNSPIPPTVLFILASFMVASFFISVFDIASDTIIQCYLIDEGGKGNEPTMAPEPLKEFMRENRDKEHDGCC